MDLTSLITIASVVVANIGIAILMFTWATNRASEDTKSLRESMEASSRETRGILQSIQAEMKDFHGRLCAMERERLDWEKSKRPS